MEDNNKTHLLAQWIELLKLMPSTLNRMARREIMQSPYKIEYSVNLDKQSFEDLRMLHRELRDLGQREVQTELLNKPEEWLELSKEELTNYIKNRYKDNKWQAVK